jgi:hypothetical protein
VSASRAARRDRAALNDADGASISFAEFDARIRDTAAWSRPQPPGDRISVMPTQRRLRPALQRRPAQRPHLTLINQPSAPPNSWPSCSACNRRWCWLRPNLPAARHPG